MYTFANKFARTGGASTIRASSIALGLHRPCRIETLYCYKDGQFLQDCTMEEMIEHCAQFVNAVNEGLEKPITKEEYIGMMKSYFPQLKRWRKTLEVNNDEAMNANPALAGIKELIAQMADKLPIAYISSVDQEGFPWTKAMLKPRKRWLNTRLTPRPQSISVMPKASRE